jgi:hypothetical protein
MGAGHILELCGAVIMIDPTSSSCAAHIWNLQVGRYEFTVLTVDYEFIGI